MRINKFVIGGILILLAVVFLIWTSTAASAEYCLTIDELNAKAPEVVDKNLRVSGAVIEAGQLEVEAAQIAFEGVAEEAKVGARTTLDVLDAEQELLTARADLVIARRDEYFSAYALLFAIGKLSVEHLGLDVGDEVPPVGAYYAAVEDRNFGYDPTDDTVWTLSYRP